MKYKNILVAVDLTKDSKKILQQSSSIANTNDSKMSVVNVVPRLIQYYSFSHFDEGIYFQEVQNNVIQNAKEHLNDLLFELDAKFDSTHVIIGPVAETIRSVSEKIDADLIIIGSHARGGISKFILGSTATSLLGGLEKDVLIINLNKNKESDKKNSIKKYKERIV